jgi:hypothetical protein
MMTNLSKAARMESAWAAANAALVQMAPKFQLTTLGTAADEILETEEALSVKIPEDVLTAVQLHNGRRHIYYGMEWNLATTDLLPVFEWEAYSEDWLELVFPAIDKLASSGKDEILEEAASHRLRRCGSDLPRAETSEMAKLLWRDLIPQYTFWRKVPIPSL